MGQLACRAWVGLRGTAVGILGARQGNSVAHYHQIHACVQCADHQGVPQSLARLHSSSVADYPPQLPESQQVVSPGWIRLHHSH